jgi:phage terminase large subunit GpA-like protein
MDIIVTCPHCKKEQILESCEEWCWSDNHTTEYMCLTCNNYIMLKASFSVIPPKDEEKR